MVFIWRGIGFLVPVIFILVGWIVSFWFDGASTKIMNADYLSWTSLFTAILLLLLGFMTHNNHKGTDDSQEKPKSKRAHFFYIPILYWGVIFGLVSIYCFAFAGKESSPETVETIIEEPVTRIVNFYNPGDDTLTYIVADETGEGLISRETVYPGQYLSLELDMKSYLFSAYDQNQETTLLLPDKEYANDTSKYLLLEDDKGQFYQRILYPATAAEDDYDEAWLVLDGKHNLILVDVTDLCSGKIKTDDIDSYEWTDDIYDIYDARDLIEPLNKKVFRGKTIRVLVPGEYLPENLEENELVYMLIPFEGENPDNSFIAGWINSLN